jgi:hypothetical protein
MIIRLIALSLLALPTLSFAESQTVDIKIDCDPPVFFENGDKLSLDLIKHYKINIDQNGNTTDYVLDSCGSSISADIATGIAAKFTAQTVLKDGRISSRSNEIIKTISDVRKPNTISITITIQCDADKCAVSTDGL